MITAKIQLASLKLTDNSSVQLAEGRRSAGAQSGRRPAAAPDAAPARGPALGVPGPRLRHQDGDTRTGARHLVRNEMSCKPLQIPCV